VARSVWVCRIMRSVVLRVCESGRRVTELGIMISRSNIRRLPHKNNVMIPSAMETSMKIKYISHKIIDLLLPLCDYLDFPNLSHYKFKIIIVLKYSDFISMLLILFRLCVWIFKVENLPQVLFMYNLNKTKETTNKIFSENKNTKCPNNSKT